MTVPHTARVWNYWLGGTDNLPADRALGDEIAKAFPVIVDIARADRAVLGRVVRHLEGEAGVRQFLDVGSGLPTAGNTHELAPASRVVYVDIDPHVRDQARALLGEVPFVLADVRDTATIVEAAGRTLDLARPVAVILSGVLAHLPGAAEARAAAQRLMAATAPGSYLVVVDGADTNAELNDVMRIWNETAHPPYAMRSPAEIRAYFDGLELIEPGLVDVTRWRPDTEAERPLDNLVGVGRKRARDAA
ncbi:SAM-dependent methyltransferase [Actinoplanes sp. RD1]|uniref:SAM-dependent methyltransferase n=1 Tax=Actinoplanes sp. RD1 TaxID=3064538 RepID=UPI002742316A|nr:SAM-dependent methyltransferase [Actinoplanes sp. RD1]